MKNLIIVESPTKARTLTRFLGDEHHIESTLGHVRDLPRKKLGVEIKTDKKQEIEDNKSPKKDNREKNKDPLYKFIPKYQIIPERRKRVSELKKIVKDSDSIILATDPDREGEAIACHIMKVIRSSKKNSQKIKRIVFHEITKSAIVSALSNPQGINMQLVDAQQARRVLDRLVGYKLSPLLWQKLGMRWLSAGRVQTVALRLIVEREREIEKFVPEEYWLIDAELRKKNQESRIKNQGEKRIFTARLVKIDGKKAEVKNKAQADRILADLETSSYRVKDVSVSKIKRNPSSPFTTSSLQQKASAKFGWSAKRTMRTAQTLYEEGLITYHRTDSTNLSKEAINSARDFAQNYFGRKYIPAKARHFKTKSKVAQEAHEAIRPTNANKLADRDLKRKIYKKNKSKLLQIDKKLGKSANLLYSLIWRRFIASQMSQALFDRTKIEVEADKYLFRASGDKMTFDGFMKIYEKKSNDEVDFPSLKKGEALDLVKLIPQQKFTEPPPRYNEGSLVKALEEKGIGRPSTYAPIISTIQSRKYVEKREKKFFPTELGFPVCDFLIKHFPDIFDYSFTAKMEDELDEVANGEVSWQKVVSLFWAPLSDRLETVSKKAKKVELPLGETDKKCPKCQGDLTIKMSRYGKFYACTNFPKCRYTKNILEKIDIPCPFCGGDMVIKKTRKGKQFYGCSNYPKCTFAAWKKSEIKKRN